MGNTIEQQQANYDAFIARASWIKGTPSDKMLQLCHNVSNDMLLMMWTEYLTFTEGLVNEVYEVELEKFLEEMGAIELVSGFVAYMQGALEVYKESLQETENKE